MAKGTTAAQELGGATENRTGLDDRTRREIGNVRSKIEDALIDIEGVSELLCDSSTGGEGVMVEFNANSLFMLHRVLERAHIAITCELDKMRFHVGLDEVRKHAEQRRNAATAG